MHISHLPFEVLQHIISFLLDDKQDLLACCLVDHRFLHASIRYMWQKIQVSPQLSNSSHDIPNISDKLKIIVSILNGTYRSDCLTSVPDSSLPGPSQSIKRKLSLVVGDQDANLQDIPLSESSRDLKNPSKRTCTENTSGSCDMVVDRSVRQEVDSPLFQYGSFVKRFAVGSIKYPTELVDSAEKNNMVDLLSKFDRLETIEVERVHGFDDLCVSSLLGSDRFVWLRSFYAVGISITDTSIETLTKCANNLVELSMIECPLVTDLALHHIAVHKPELIVLDISSSINITSRGLQLLIAGEMSRLQVLGLGRCVRLDGSIIVELCVKQQHLRILAVNEIANLHEDHFLALASRCVNLHNLNVEKCTYFSDRSFISFLSNCKSLVSVSTTYCRRLTDNCLNFVSNNLKLIGLQEVFFGKCILLSPDALARFFSATPFLKRVYLAGNTQVDDRCVLSLIKSCPKLEVLSVPGCSITDASVLGACSLRDTVTVVQFSFCRNISLNAVGRLAHECKRLTIMQLVNCSQFENTYVPMYSNPCPQNLHNRYGDHYYAIRSQNIQRLGLHWKCERDSISRDH